MKLGKLVTYGEVNAFMNSHVLLTTWSHDKLKTKYFFLQKTYGLQTLNGTDIE